MSKSNLQKLIIEIIFLILKYLANISTFKENGESDTSSKVIKT